VTVGRGGWTGPSPRSAVTVRSGAVAIGPVGGALLGEVATEQARSIGSGEVRTFRVPAPSGPFRIEVSVAKTFVPAEIDPNADDARALGAQVSFQLVPRQ
jgi:hypothetical protein